MSVIQKQTETASVWVSGKIWQMKKSVILFPSCSIKYTVRLSFE